MMDDEDERPETSHFGLPRTYCACAAWRWRCDTCERFAAQGGDHAMQEGKEG